MISSELSGAVWLVASLKTSSNLWTRTAYMLTILRLFLLPICSFINVFQIFAAYFSFPVLLDLKYLCSGNEADTFTRSLGGQSWDCISHPPKGLCVYFLAYVALCLIVWALEPALVKSHFISWYLNALWQVI